MHMLSQTGIFMFSTSIRRLTRKEAHSVRNDKDRGLVFSVSRLHNASLFVCPSRLMGTQSPDALIAVLCFSDTFTDWKATFQSSLFTLNVRVFCGLILKRVACLFHGTFATLSEQPSTDFRYRTDALHH